MQRDIYSVMCDYESQLCIHTQNRAECSCLSWEMSILCVHVFGGSDGERVGTETRQKEESAINTKEKSGI